MSRPPALDGRVSGRLRHRRTAVSVLTLLAGLWAIRSLCCGERRSSAFLGAEIPSRRALLFGSLFGSFGLGSEPARAFKNRVEKLRNEPKSPGKKPEDLGVSPRKEGGSPDLKGCGATPNCFSSSSTSQDSYVEPWRFSKGGASKAFADLQGAVEAYQPGQRGIDGGGFQVQEANAESGYLYVQFESLKKGYKDDVEFLVRADASGEGGEVRVRSASRQGQKDFGVNAKRLNGIAEGLAKLDGWSAPLLTNDRFPEYVRLNSDPNYGQTGPKIMQRGEMTLAGVVMGASKAR